MFQGTKMNIKQLFSRMFAAGAPHPHPRGTNILVFRRRRVWTTTRLRWVSPMNAPTCLLSRAISLPCPASSACMGSNSLARSFRAKPPKPKLNTKRSSVASDPDDPRATPTVFGRDKPKPGNHAD